MYEVRIHGRGGQGAVLAAQLLATALVFDGKYAVSIPAFGFERRGAPVVSFIRASETPIRQLTNIYAPDCIIWQSRWDIGCGRRGERLEGLGSMRVRRMVIGAITISLLCLFIRTRRSGGSWHGCLLAHRAPNISARSG